ncbi:MAG: hypothetical protein KGH94_01990 [Candidatus Micrarchaeota archaeon]|nr:hypothetical protein [Candidatus Micrarchaeota archaeon]
MPTTTERPLDREIREFAVRYKEYTGLVLIRLKELNGIFGESVPLMRMAMSAAEHKHVTSYDSSSEILNSIRKVATPVIRSGDEKEKETVYVFMNAITLFDDVNQRVRLASHIAEVMEGVTRRQVMEETTEGKEATRILSAINKTLGHPLSHSSWENFEDAVEIAAAFRNMSRALKDPIKLIDVADIIQKDWLAELRRREREGTD